MKIRKLVTGLLVAGGVCSTTLTIGAGFGAGNEVQAATTKTTKETILAKATVKNGWVKENGKFKYYKNGIAYVGWHKMGKAEGEKVAHYSYFGKDGALYTGWHKMGKAEGEKVEHYSYFGNNGWLQTGWKHFNKTKTEAAHDSYFGADGWLRTGWQLMGTSKNPDGKNKQHYSYFGANGWLQTGWKHFNKTKTEAAHDSYFGGNGWLVTNTTKKVDGTKFKFDARGWATKVVENITSTSDVDTSGWSQGPASAYGGATDPGCGSTTATGARVTESSMGVAIPMAWGRRDLLGHKVMIAYGNKVVTATINDVGGMGGGSRHLDLQPGVFRAFGYSSCNSWGVRTVKYKIL